MSWLDILLHPILALKHDDEDGEGLDVLYPLSVFFALGIFLVFQRYQAATNSAVPFQWRVPNEADPNWQSINIADPCTESHLADPELLPHAFSTDRKYITCFDPATGLHIRTELADGDAEIEAKIGLAAIAQKKWKEKSFTQRRRVIRSLLKWLVDNQEACARVACRDTGKTLVDAALGEIITTCSKMEWIIAHGEQALRPESRSGNFMLFYKESKVYYDPLGVVAGIVSWNYPLHNAWSPILAAIFSGNGIVLKCSENVVWSTRWFVGAITECLRVCHPNEDLEQLVQVVCCWPEQAATLTRSPLIKHITFIGSESVGRIVAADALVNLTPICLELGGKDPAVILPDTDLKKWASLWMRGIFQNAGQNCIGIERVIVHWSQYDALYELLADRIEKLRQGPVLAPSPEGFVPTVDCGSMISNARFAGLENIIEEAVTDGAKLYGIGGRHFEHVYHQHGAYFTPTLIGPVTKEMNIAQEELFAPVAVLMPYDTIEEAIDIANGTRYGLGASVFGPDQRMCLKVAKELDCGMVSVNDFGVSYLNQDLPFGGTKNSGYGRFGGPEGLRALTNPKAIMVDRWPSFIQTSIPAVLDYPIRSLSHSWDFVSGLIRFLYADGWRARIRGLVTLMKASK